MKTMRLPLLWKMFFLYIGILVIGTLLLTAKNVWVHHSTLDELKQFFFGAILIFNLIFLTVIQLITVIRFRKVNRYFRGVETTLSADEVLSILLRFPMQLFWSLIGVAFALSIAFHITQIMFKDSLQQLPLTELLSMTFGSMLSEIALAVTLAVLLYSVVRTTVQSYVQQLQRVQLDENIARTTITRPFFVIYISGFVIIAFDVLRGIIDEAAPIQIASLIKMATVDIAFTLGVVFVMIWGLRRQVRALQAEILALELKNRSSLLHPLFIRSTDEMGQLTESFNAVQERLRKRYHRIDEELALAYAVHELLVSNSNSSMGAFTIAAEPHAGEALGEWFDVIPLEQESLVVIVGVITGYGMPAALASTAARYLFRSSLRERTSIQDAVAHVYQQLREMLPMDVHVSLGAAKFNPRQHVMEATIVGEMSLCIARSSNTVDESPLQFIKPLGAKHRDSLHTTRQPLQHGDRFIFSSVTIQYGDVV